MAKILPPLLDLTHAECSLSVRDEIFNPEGKYKCCSSFMLPIQVLTAVKNKYQPCRFQTRLLCWCLLFLPAQVGLVSQALPEGPLLFLTHVPSCS